MNKSFEDFVSMIEKDYGYILLSYGENEDGFFVEIALENGIKNTINFPPLREIEAYYLFEILKKYFKSKEERKISGVKYDEN